MNKKFNLEKCPILESVEIISKKWVILVIVVIGNSGKLRYSEIMKKLDGINHKSLADTLKELEKLALVNRKSFNQIPRRVEYNLTKTGLELYHSTVPFLQWASDRTGDKDCPILKTTLSKNV